MVPINENIRADKVQVIDQNGVNQGVLPLSQALLLAKEAELDLVLLSETGNQGAPVTKIMDFGKALYEKKKKLSEAKKHQKIIQVKEIKLRPTIDTHDYETKLTRGINFLRDGKHLKVTLMFKGREVATKRERGKDLFDRINKTFEENDLLKQLVQEKDSAAGRFWSRIYYLK
ncbi:translation initiation factor IF-3 [bacterium]|nr:translation initiation factor IF-3 [bacterium]